MRWLARAIAALALLLGLALAASPASAAPRQGSTMSAAPTMSAPPTMSAAPSRGMPPSMGAPPSMSNAPAPGAAPRRRPTGAQGIPSPAPSWLDSSTRVGRVVVRFPAGMDRLARRLAEAAERALARAATDLEGLPAPGPIEVRLVDQASALPRVAPNQRGAPPYAVGVAYPDLGVVTIAQRRAHEVLDAEATLRHELAHIALGVALGPDVPRWLHEGFAYQHSAEWSWDRTETLAGMVWFHSIIPLEQLDASFPAQELATHRAYAQSYDFVGFLSRRGRWADNADDGERFPFRRFLGLLSAGKSLDEAAIGAFGRPVKALFGEWQDDLTNRLMFAPVGVFMAGLWLLATVLLVLAWRRRRRQARDTLRRWSDEEASRHGAAAGIPTFAELARAEEAHAQAAAERAAAGADGSAEASGDDDPDAASSDSTAPAKVIVILSPPIASAPSPSANTPATTRPAGDDDSRLN